jgi:hypothetical protein
MNLPDLYQVLAGAVGTTVVLRGTTFPIKIASVHRAGSRLVLEGRALDGSKVTRTLAARSESPLVPAWAIRLGSMLRLSWGSEAGVDWDRIIKEIIAHAGLPVDPKKNWGPLLYSIFSRDWNLAKGDPELLDDLIQESVVSMLHRRSIEGFDPNKVVNPGPGFEKLSLAEKVSQYVIQLLHGQAGERARKENGPNGYKNLNIDSLDHDNADPFDDEEGGGQRKELADSEIVQDSDDEVRSLSQIRDAFENWLQKRRGGQQPYKIMLVFDLWTREPSQIDAVRAWKDITNTSYQIYNATQKLLREALIQFANSGPLRRDPFLVRVVNDLRLKSFQGDESPETTEPLQADPDLIPAEPEPESAPAPVEPPVIPPGPKAQAMKSTKPPV